MVKRFREESEPCEDCATGEPQLLSENDDVSDVHLTSGGQASAVEDEGSPSHPPRSRRLRPRWTREEEAVLVEAHCALGNAWSAIAGCLPGRTTAEVKNIWHSTLRAKKLQSRSVLRTYVRVLKDRADQPAVRQRALRAARRLLRKGNAYKAEKQQRELEQQQQQQQQQEQEDASVPEEHPEEQPQPQPQQYQHLQLQLPARSPSPAALPTTAANLYHQPPQQQVQHAASESGSDGSVGLPYNMQQQQQPQQQQQQQRPRPRLVLRRTPQPQPQPQPLALPQQQQQPQQVMVARQPATAAAATAYPAGRTSAVQPCAAATSSRPASEIVSHSSLGSDWSAITAANAGHPELCWHPATTTAPATNSGTTSVRNSPSAAKPYDTREYDAAWNANVYNGTYGSASAATTTTTTTSQAAAAAAAASVAAVSAANAVSAFAARNVCAPASAAVPCNLQYNMQYPTATTTAGASANHSMNGTTASANCYGYSDAGSSGPTAAPTAWQSYNANGSASAAATINPSASAAAAAAAYFQDVSVAAAADIPADDDALFSLVDDDEWWQQMLQSGTASRNCSAGGSGASGFDVIENFPAMSSQLVMYQQNDAPGMGMGMGMGAGMGLMGVAPMQQQQPMSMSMGVAPVMGNDVMAAAPRSSYGCATASHLSYSPTVDTEQMYGSGWGYSDGGFGEVLTMGLGAIIDADLLSCLDD
ncbi:hypothetical protein Agub_g5284 [Astrephomene gubernaculifera]|uniref:Uncharacterized protein n=1 Tax=Astrephomene gubernaculifera TaxID=47775 RepID=A0AAD3HKN2_9CHLO|nr:hypothetical protein Agub_g5284 [Astrephomene gubernaculifera]